jgi:hypothetical protein
VKDLRDRIEYQRRVVERLHRVEADAGEAEASLAALLDDEASKLRILDYLRTWRGLGRKCQPIAFSAPGLAMARISRGTTALSNRPASEQAVRGLSLFHRGRDSSIAVRMLHLASKRGSRAKGAFRAPTQ